MRFRSGWRRFCPTVVITDARQIEAYYLERYGKRDAVYSLRRGDGKRPSAEVLAKLGLERRRILSVRQPDGAGEQRAAGAGGL